MNSGHWLSQSANPSAPARARSGWHVEWASAVLLWLAGAYIVYYWLTAIRLF